MKKLSYLLLMLCITSLSSFAQTTISGTITDAATKLGLPGATVLVKGTNVGAITDLDGKFTLQSQSTLTMPVTLKVGSIGYIRVEVEAKENSGVTIALSEEQSMLGQLTVTGNRVEEKITKAGVTIEKITARTLQLVPAFDQYSALQSIGTIQRR